MLTRALALLTRIFLAVAVIMLVISGVLLVRYAQFERSSVTAPGTVVEMVVTGSNCPNGGNDCDDVAAPRVAFTPLGGSVVTFRSTRSSSPPAYAVGDQVRVRYVASDPTTARIDSSTALIPAVVVGGLGLVFLAAALLWWRIGRLSRRRSGQISARASFPFGDPQTTPPPGDDEPSDPPVDDR